MEENNPGDYFGNRFETESERQFFGYRPDTESRMTNRPGLTVKDLMQVEGQQEGYDDEEPLGSYPDGSEEGNSYEDQGSDGQNSEDGGYEDDEEYQNNYEIAKDQHSYDKYMDYRQDEHVDLSYPHQNQDYNKTRNYDTKDTIDEQLEKFKKSFNQEDYCYKFNNPTSTLAHKSEDYLTFQKTVHQNPSHHSSRDSNYLKYEDLPQSNMQKSSSKPNADLSNRLGIMKSAAVRMIASTYNQPQNPPDHAQLPYESEADGFDSSTNNLISTSRARVQQINEVIIFSEFLYNDSHRR